jgi:hypothetical protein
MVWKGLRSRVRYFISLVGRSTFTGEMLTAFHSSPSFDPTGESTPPPASPSQLLYVQIEPRYSIYLSSEATGSFIVDATLSKYFGSKYQALTNGVPKLQQLLFLSMSRAASFRWLLTKCK